MSETMTSNKPYLIRAFYDWISDNDLTPYIVVDINVYGVLVPMAFVNDGQIVLNISAGAVGTIALGSESIEFSARFGGKLEHITVPYGAIGAIYAKENGVGTSLPIEHVEASETVEEALEPSSKSTLALADFSSPDTEDKVTTEGENKKSSSKKKPGLRVVK